MLDVMLKIISRQKKDKYLVLVVDDNSPDGTGELGKAMIRGYRYSIEKLRADVFVSNEADFAFDPKMIPLTVKRLEKAMMSSLGG
jgi:glycosyltransferase involved in cell wall biosynthesis